MGFQAAAHPDRPWHALTWLVWSCAGSAAIQLAPNPVYVVMVIGIAWLVVAAHGHDGPFARAFPFVVSVAVVFGILRVVLTALTTHGGPDVLFSLPSFTLPNVLGGFMVGGSVEAPILAQAASEGLLIVGIVAVFGAFNAVVAHYELVGSAPRAFHEVGLIVVVALAFVPSTIAAVHDVGEADRARTGGRAVRRGRLVRRLVPVLESGLERAVTLSESLDSRGFAFGGSTHRERGAGWFGVGALLALGATFVALIARQRTVAGCLAVVGVIGVVLAVWLAGGTTRRVRYRRRRLQPIDWTCMGLCLLAPALLGLINVIGDDTLTWNASPLTWPGLHLVVALALVPLLAPLVRLPAPAIVPGSAPAPTGRTLASARA